MSQTLLNSSPTTYDAFVQLSRVTLVTDKDPLSYEMIHSASGHGCIIRRYAVHPIYLLRPKPTARVTLAVPVRQQATM